MTLAKDCFHSTMVIMWGFELVTENPRIDLKNYCFHLTPTEAKIGEKYLDLVKRKNLYSTGLALFECLVTRQNVFSFIHHIQCLPYTIKLDCTE